jgi:hypothetical protein
MGLTHVELFRLLPQALEWREHTINGSSIRVGDGDQTALIELGPQHERKIASLVLPVTHVDLSLNGFTDEQAQAFVQRFDRTYQRGGG